MIDFRPIIKSLGLDSAPETIASAELQTCLEQSCYGDNLRHHDDPTRFFLHSAATVDQVSSAIFQLPPWYEVKSKSVHSCFDCPFTSPVYDAPTSVISLSLTQDYPCNVMDLILSQFSDEQFHRPCQDCGSVKHGVSKRLLTCPKVLALHIRRYNNNFQTKFSNVVIPTEELDLSKVLDTDQLHTKYKLRCV